MFLRFGRFVYRRRWQIVVAWALLALASLPLAPTLPAVLKAGGYGDAQLESQRAFDLLARILGWKGNTLVAVFHSDTLATDDPRFVAAADDAVASLPGTPGIGEISTFERNPQQVSASHHSAYDTIELVASPEEAHRLLPVIRGKLRSDVVQVELTGGPAFYSDVET